MKKEKEMARSNNKSSFTIDSSVILDNLFKEAKFANMSTLQKIEYLNKLRVKRRLYGYGQNMMDYMINDQPGRHITFNNFKDNAGIPSRPISLYWSFDYNDYLIEYPVLAAPAELLNDPNKPVVPYEGQGQHIAIRRVHDFLRYGVGTSWGTNEAYARLFKRLRYQYESAWLNLKRRKVAELKATLDGDSVSEFIAAKRAEKTQAIMDIAMSVASLTAKLETYRNRIGSVTNVREAEKMFDEVHNQFQNLTYVQSRNQKRLNTEVRIPGGARVKRLAETDES